MMSLGDKAFLIRKRHSPFILHHSYFILSLSFAIIHSKTSPSFRQGGLENHAFVTNGMIHSQPSGVEGDAPPECPVASIFAVADDRIPQLGELQPDLMFPPGMQFHLDEGEAFSYDF